VQPACAGRERGKPWEMLTSGPGEVSTWQRGPHGAEDPTLVPPLLWGHSPLVKDSGPGALHPHNGWDVLQQSGAREQNLQLWQQV